MSSAIKQVEMIGMYDSLEDSGLNDNGWVARSMVVAEYSQTITAIFAVLPERREASVDLPQRRRAEAEALIRELDNMPIAQMPPSEIDHD